MSVTEKYKGKIIKKVHNSGISKEEHASLLGQINELNGTVTSLNGQLNESEEKNATLNGTVASLNGQINELNGTVGTLNGRVNELNETVELLNGQVNDSIENINNECTELKNTVTNANNAIGDLSHLQTGDKDNLIDAVNELFQKVDSGKRLIADAIDEESITSDSSFNAMSMAIEDKNEMLLNKDNELNSITAELTNGKQLLIDTIGNENINTDSSFEDISEAIKGLSSVNEDEIKNCLISSMQEAGISASSSESIDTLISRLNSTKFGVLGVKDIACGDSQTFITLHDNTILFSGQTTYYQSGGASGTAFVNATTTASTSVGQNVKKVSCGYRNSFVIKNDGTLWSCGANEKGQLGQGTTATKSELAQVATNVKKVVSGNAHTIILKNDGSVWTAGSNTYGQLGIGTVDENAHSTFTKVIDSGVIDITCGRYFSTVLKEDGSIWSAGYNQGTLGVGDTTDRSTFTKASITFNVNEIKKISANLGDNLYVLKTDGTLYGCGYNAYGQFGIATSPVTTLTKLDALGNDIVDMANGNGHILLVKEDGYLYTIGRNSHGQLGLGDTTNRSVLTKTSFNNINIVSCGYTFSFIYKNDGYVYGCGNCGQGQLGFGHRESTNSSFYRIKTKLSY